MTKPSDGAVEAAREFFLQEHGRVWLAESHALAEIIDRLAVAPAVKAAYNSGTNQVAAVDVALHKGGHGWPGTGRGRVETIESMMNQLAAAEVEVERLKAERGSALDREQLGQIVRMVWLKWANQQDSPKPSWLESWDEMQEEDREVDRQIGEAVAAVCVSPELLRVEAECDALREAAQDAWDCGSVAGKAYRRNYLCPKCAGKLRAALANLERSPR